MESCKDCERLTVKVANLRCNIYELGNCGRTMVVHIHNLKSILQSPQPMQALVDALITHLKLMAPHCITKAQCATTDELSATGQMNASHDVFDVFRELVIVDSR